MERNSALTSDGGLSVIHQPAKCCLAFFQERSGISLTHRWSCQPAKVSLQSQLAGSRVFLRAVRVGDATRTVMPTLPLTLQATAVQLPPRLPPPTAAHPAPHHQRPLPLPPPLPLPTAPAPLAQVHPLARPRLPSLQRRLCNTSTAMLHHRVSGPYFLTSQDRRSSRLTMWSCPCSVPRQRRPLLDVSGPSSRHGGGPG